MADVSEADRAVAGEYLAPKGELSIAGSLAFGRLHLLPVVIAYLNEHPDVDVRLSLTDPRHDLLADGMEDLRDRPFSERRQRLEAFIARYKDTFFAELAKARLSELTGK